ncbi:LLM class flavin-dependent oxidoreductase [Actinomadura sp. 21ATH]|uniref:LLM class flavin-dependent oxidoreductase n=1 Tax=Actinomadura sp. 21ATH TaxID=1735444 RepID=UPI0035C24ADB
MSPGARVQAGLLLPTREAAITGDLDERALVRLAQRAERLGFDSVWAGDSLVARPRAEPLALLAAVAAATERITVGTAALTAPLRHPLTAAHAIATIDRLSEGRLILGLGAGFPYPATAAEFGLAGVPFAERAGRLMETVRLWRSLWSREPPGSFTGRYWHFSGLDGLPRPARIGGPALWLAGGGPSAPRRVAAGFDGWLPYPPTSREYREGIDAIHAATAAGPRRDTAPTGGLYVTVLPCTGAEPARQALDTYTRAYYGAPIEAMRRSQAFIAGTPEHCLARLREYVDAGATHIILRIGALDPAPYLEPIAGLAAALTKEPAA